MKGFCLKVKRFFTAKQHKYLNGSKGVISIFLACMMLPFAYMADLLVESGRYNESMSMAEQALANAEMSTMSDYDEYLMNRFGLAAVSQETECSAALNRYLNKSYKSMASGSNIEVKSVDGTLSLNDNEALMRQVEEASKYSLPAYYAGNTINALLDKIRECKVGKQLEFLMEVLGSAAKVADSIVLLFKAYKDLYKSSEAVKTNVNKYVTRYTKLVSAVDDVASKKGEFEAALSDLNAKEGVASGAQESLTKCLNLINAYKSAINQSDLPDEIKNELVRYINKLDKATDTTYNDMSKYIDEKIEDKAKILVFTHDGKEIKVKYTDLPNTLKQLDYKGKIDSNNRANEAVTSASAEYEQARSRIQPAIDTFNTVKAEYLEIIDALTADSNTLGSLRHFSAKIADAIEKKDEVKSSFKAAVQAHVMDFETYRDEDIKGWKKEKEDLEKKKDKTTDKEKIKEYEEKIKDLKDKIGDQEGYYENIKEGMDKGQKAYDAFLENPDPKKLFSNAYVNAANKACTELGRVRENVNALTSDSITPSTNLRANQSNYFYDLSNAYSPKNLLADVLDQFWNMITDFKSIIKRIKAAVAVIESVFAKGGFYNNNLTAHIKGDLLASSSFETVIKNMADFFTALDNLNIINSISKLDIIGTVDKFIHFFDSIKMLVSSSIKLVESLRTFVSDVVNNLVNQVTDLTSGKYASRLVLALYLLNSLPNRTNYDSGKCITTGMAFTDIARTDRDFEGILSPLELKSMYRVISEENQKEAEDNVFSGAELEYILTGGRSEIINQMAAFFQIYAIRFVFDIIPVAMNEFVQELAESLGECTFGIGAVIVYLVYLLAEPYLDTTLLAMGNKQPIIKRPSKVFLTPEGLPTLLKEFTKISLDTATKEKIKEEGAKMIGKSKEDIKEAAMTDEDKADAADKSGNKSVLDSIKAQYSTYILLLIFLELPRDEVLGRFKNLISLECKEYYRKKSRSFEISKAYTYLQVDATVEFSPILPLEPISYSAFKKIDIRQSRGY